MRSAVLQTPPLGHGAQRLLRGRGLWPEPRVLDLTARRRPGWWVVTWDITCEGATSTVRTTKDILPKPRVHCELGARPDSTGPTPSRCRCGSPTRLGSCAGPAPGRLVKMHILIQRVWDGAAGSLTHPLRMRKMLVEGPRLRKQQHGPGRLRLGGGSQRPAERRGGPLEHVRQEVRRHGVSAGCWGAACTRRRRKRK